MRGGALFLPEYYLSFFSLTAAPPTDFSVVLAHSLGMNKSVGHFGRRFNFSNFTHKKSRPAVPPLYCGKPPRHPRPSAALPNLNLLRSKKKEATQSSSFGSFLSDKIRAKSRWQVGQIPDTELNHKITASRVPPPEIGRDIKAPRKRPNHVMANALNSPLARFFDTPLSDGANGDTDGGRRRPSGQFSSPSLQRS